jgi:hypothetical protein
LSDPRSGSTSPSRALIKSASWTTVFTWPVTIVEDLDPSLDGPLIAFADDGYDQVVGRTVRAARLQRDWEVAIG